MDLVDSLINDKTVQVKAASMLLIFLVASVSLWSAYVAPVLAAANVNHFSNSGTTFHKITVNDVDEEVLLQIEPLTLPSDLKLASYLTLPSTGCPSCSCGQKPAQNQTYPSRNGSSIEIVNYTVLEQSESRAVVLVIYKFNGTTFKATVATDLLWTYNERLNDANIMAKFLSGEVTVKDKSVQFYVLSYLVQHAKYWLVMHTVLLPSDSETYNGSFTILDYAPAGKSGWPLSLELVNFNLPVTLSQNYRALGKVANEVGKLYEKNETLAYLAEGYLNIEAETKCVANLVSSQLPEYDRAILQSTGIIMDPWECDYDFECVDLYGSGYCCNTGTGMCQTCPTPCVENLECLADCFSDATFSYYVCLGVCAVACGLSGPGYLACFAACSFWCEVEFAIGMAYCHQKCCW